MMKAFVKDDLKVEVYETRLALGEAAAQDIVRCLCSLLNKKDHVNMIFAAAPSQNEVLNTLATSKEVDWSRVNAFHMDEYIGLETHAPQRFGNYLAAAIFQKVPFRQVYYIHSESSDPEQECKRYAALLDQFPADIVCMGIGENSHIAFNDPHVANFKDPELVKIVELDDMCRQQQVNDGCFQTLGEVPSKAITLTVPALMRCKFVFCVVPGHTKAQAVFHTLREEIKPTYPSTILRDHKSAKLYLDKESAEYVME